MAASRSLHRMVRVHACHRRFPNAKSKPPMSIVQEATNMIDVTTSRTPSHALSLSLRNGSGYPRHEGGGCKSNDGVAAMRFMPRPQAQQAIELSVNESKCSHSYDKAANETETKISDRAREHEIDSRTSENNESYVSGRGRFAASVVRRVGAFERTCNNPESRQITRRFRE